jgi:hypothetical protein
MYVLFYKMVHHPGTQIKQYWIKHNVFLYTQLPYFAQFMVFYAILFVFLADDHFVGQNM